MARSGYVVATGRPRRVDGAQRPWRAVLYKPSPRYRLFRVAFKEEIDGAWEWTARSAPTEDEARKIFTQVERALDDRTFSPPRSRVQRERTCNALSDLYLEDSRARGKAVRTVEQRESRLRAHIRPVLGDLPVVQWRVSHSRQVIATARDRGVKSVTYLSDIRQDMAAMRKLAWRESWLPRDHDPLDGLSLPRRQQLQGAGRGYVPPELRPERRQVDAMAAAADELTRAGPPEVRRLPLLGPQIRVAGYGGLRLGEQLALRAIDVHFDRGVVSVNGSWTQPRAYDSPPFRGPVKNGVLHDVPLPRSVLDQLLPRCAVLLGLPESASRSQVAHAQTAERIRRGKLASSPDRWWEVDVEPAHELWLFVDADTALPPRTELLNDRWHRVRRWLARSDPDNAWPAFVPYRNLRHHAASFWHDELQREWADVAAWLGDQLTTVISHYVRSGAYALADVAGQLEDY
jgi:integrase